MSIQTETARDVLLSAFEDIVVRMDEETLGASDMLTGVKTINRIMAMLSENGVDLGFTKLAKISDLITIPEGVIDALVSLLALRLWPSYRTGEPSSQLVINARRGLAQMYKSGIEIGATEYPSTLPMGSGNEDSGGTYDIFYPDLDDTILAENNGSISLEDNTNTGTALPSVPSVPSVPPEPIVVEVTQVASAPAFPLMSILSVGDYLYGFVSYLQTAARLYRWAPGDSSWAEIASTSLDGMSMGTFNGDIFFGTARFTHDGAELLKWDGSTGFDVKATYSSTAYIEISSIIEYDNNLYAGTNDEQRAVPNTENGNLLMWDGGSTLIKKATTPDESIIDMCVYNNKLYVGTEAGNLYEYDDSASLNLVGTLPSEIPSTYCIRHLVAYDNKLYMAAVPYYAPGSPDYLLVWNDVDTLMIAAPTFDPVETSMASLAVINGNLMSGMGAGFASKDVMVKYNNATNEWELYFDFYAEGFSVPYFMMSLADHLGKFYAQGYFGGLLELTYPT